MSLAYEPGQLDEIERRITVWLADELETNPAMRAVDRGEPGQRRWYVRMAGEDKDFTTVWLTLGQRTLAYETYVMPAPEENHCQFFEHLLRRNAKLVGVQFCIGDEDALYLVGALPLSAFSEAELDRVLGTMGATVELCFRAALRIGFATRFTEA
jgi:Putative bacterial sensory transduction regulator